MSYELKQLDPERDRSDELFKLKNAGVNDGETIVVGKDGREFSIKDADQPLRSLLHKLIEVANRRTCGFDPLLNSIEAWTILFRDIKTRCPEALESGLLQAMVDLDACLHDLVVGAQPHIVANRPKYFDGGVRWREWYLEAAETGKTYRLPTKKRVRRYEDIIMAHLVVVFDMLTAGRKDNDQFARKTMNVWLKDYSIHNIDGAHNREITVKDLLVWRRCAREAKRQLGVRYEYLKLTDIYKDFLTDAADLTQEELDGRREEARRIIVWTRARLPSNNPPIEDPDNPFRPSGAPGRWQPGAADAAVAQKWHDAHLPRGHLGDVSR